MTLFTTVHQGRSGVKDRERWNTFSSSSAFGGDHGLEFVEVVGDRLGEFHEVA
jgi:hypothetical protein